MHRTLEKQYNSNANAATKRDATQRIRPAHALALEKNTNDAAHAKLPTQPEMTSKMLQLTIHEKQKFG